MEDIRKNSNEQSYYRKEILRNFFVEVLGVDHRVAEEGASKMEHVISEDIAERLVRYVCNLKTERKTPKKNDEMDK